MFSRSLKIPIAKRGYESVIMVTVRLSLKCYEHVL